MSICDSDLVVCLHCDYGTHTSSSVNFLSYCANANNQYINVQIWHEWVLSALHASDSIFSNVLITLCVPGCLSCACVSEGSAPVGVVEALCSLTWWAPCYLVLLRPGGLSLLGSGTFTWRPCLKDLCSSATDLLHVPAVSLRAPPDVSLCRCLVPCPCRPWAGCCQPGRRMICLWRTCCSSRWPGRSPTKVSLSRNLQLVIDDHATEGLPKNSKTRQCVCWWCLLHSQPVTKMCWDHI